MPVHSAQQQLQKAAECRAPSPLYPEVVEGRRSRRCSSLSICEESKEKAHGALREGQVGKEKHMSELKKEVVIIPQSDGNDTLESFESFEEQNNGNTQNDEEGNDLKCVTCKKSIKTKRFGICSLCNKPEHFIHVNRNLTVEQSGKEIPSCKTCSEESPNSLSQINESESEARRSRLVTENANLLSQIATLQAKLKKKEYNCH